jgi:glycosyltransferase involved in cell wall biosynthesis
MRVLFATNHAYLPDHVGGSESSTHDLCLTLREQGVDAGVLCAALPRATLAPRRRVAALLRRRDAVVRDETFGYPVFRCARPAAAIAAVVEGFGPAVAVLQAGRPLALLDPFLAAGVPCAVYLRDASFEDLGGAVARHPAVRYLATSRDLARRFSAAFGIDPLCIPPLVRPERYRVDSSRTHVTFVCPFAAKGVDMALTLAARRPDVPFLFVESWQVHPLRRVSLNARVRAIPSITYRRPTPDMRAVYAVTKLVLVPSRWPEAWGRVVSEAQLSGIPVIASRIGGLPESVGPGGILVDPAAGLDAWEDALARLWDDSAEYERLAALARRHADRPGFQPSAIVEQLRQVLSELAPAGRRPVVGMRGR